MSRVTRAIDYRRRARRRWPKAEPIEGTGRWATPWTEPDGTVASVTLWERRADAERVGREVVDLARAPRVR